MSYQPFLVIDSATGQELDGMPTPALIEQGGEAYRHPDEPRIWRLRDDSYDPKGTVYTRVRIKHVKEFTVFVEVQLFETGSDEVRDPFADQFIVVAGSEYEAKQLAPAKAIEYWQDREPDCAVNIIVTRAREGAHF